MMAQESSNDANIVECRAQLEALGKHDIEWTLPLGLEYPNKRMERQVEVLQNTLSLRLVASQRAWEDEFSNTDDQLRERLDSLEDQVQNLVVEANTAQATAAQEQTQLQEARRQRELERQRREAARQERERQRLERERQARAEAEALQCRLQDEQNKDRRAFAAVVGQAGNAGHFGGNGDFRMCRHCKAGPVENIACADLATHNDSSTRYNGHGVASRDSPNHCPNCNWFDADWHQWPMWDGIHGPH